MRCKLGLLVIGGAVSVPSESRGYGAGHSGTQSREWAAEEAETEGPPGPLPVTVSVPSESRGYGAGHSGTQSREWAAEEAETEGPPGPLPVTRRTGRPNFSDLAIELISRMPQHARLL